MTNKDKVAVKKSDLPLERFYHWEKERCYATFLTQPIGDGAVREFSWSQAANEARRVAAWLQAQKYPAGSRIAILGKNSAHWVIADMAIWMAGYVSVPIYPTFNAEALRYILDHSEAKLCFVGKMDDTNNLAEGVPEDVTLVAMPLSPPIEAHSWDHIVHATKPLKGKPVRNGEEMATIVYTSGTTGNPKGVMHSFNALAWALTSALHRISMDSDDRMLSYLPLAHIAERMLVEQGAVRTGAHIYFAESLDTFIKDIQRAQPTIFFSVPRLWVKFQQGVQAKMPPKKLNRLLKMPVVGGLVRKKILKGLGLGQTKLAVGGAAPMPADVLHFYHDLGLDLIEGYGMTENCALSHGTLPGTSRPGTVGFAYDGVEQRIDKETGEIQMRGGCLMMGYYKDPAQTAASFTDDGWLHTGDKGVVEADGCLKITGRVKDLFKTSKGKYIAPAPIEDILITHPDVEACCVTGANMAQPIGIVMLSPDAVTRISTDDQRTALVNSLAQHLKAVNGKLESHEHLDFLSIVTHPWTPENGFVTPTLKVKRNKIEEAYSAHFDAWLHLRKPVVWSNT
jgi:long-chain acyl-CoA synthetase